MKIYIYFFKNLIPNYTLIYLSKFLFISKKKNTIQGFVHHSLIKKFRSHIRSSIEIYNFNIQDYNKNYQVSDHKFQIILTERTTITSVDQSFCKRSFDFFVYIMILFKIQISYTYLQFLYVRLSMGILSS